MITTMMMMIRTMYDYNYNNDAVDDDDYNNDDDDDALMREVAASCSQSCSAGQICIQIRADD